MEKVVKIKDIVDALSLKVLTGEEFLEKEILLAEIHYPGLELTGYLINYSREINNSIHIFGNKEVNYLNGLDYKTRKNNLMNYFSYDFPCLIFLKSVNVSEDIIKIAQRFKRPLLVADEEDENKFDEKITSYLRRVLGPEIVINNFTLLEVFGIGILLSGSNDYRIGSIIELIRKKHRLVAENVVNIKRLSNTLIVGSSLKIEKDSKHFVKLSENNIFKVSDFFGIGAIRNSKEIDILIKVEDWEDGKAYDRLGVKYLKQDILGVEIPKIIIPFKKGRNISTLIEVAAMNRRLQKRGKNSALIFMEKLTKLIKDKNGDNNNFIKINEIKTRFKFKLLNRISIEEILIKKSEVYRPSIEFVEGFKDFKTVEEMVHAIGEPEIKYLESLPREKREKLLNNYFSIKFPCLVISYDKRVPEFIIKKATKKNIPLLHTNHKLNSFIVDLTDFIATSLSAGVVMHGVFIEIFGIGVLLTGKSGLGKSETALELIHRGHRLVADDIVKLNKLRDGRIVGKASRIPHFMEVRGLGIIDIRTLYGLGAVKNVKELSLIIELYEFENKENIKQNYVEEYKKVLGKSIKKINFYVTPGRSIASIIEILSMKFRKRN